MSSINTPKQQDRRQAANVCPNEPTTVYPIVLSADAVSCACILHVSVRPSCSGTANVAHWWCYMQQSKAWSALQHRVRHALPGEDTPLTHACTACGRNGAMTKPARIASQHRQHQPRPYQAWGAQIEQYANMFIAGTCNTSVHDALLPCWTAATKSPHWTACKSPQQSSR